MVIVYNFNEYGGIQTKHAKYDLRKFNIFTLNALYQFVYFDRAEKYAKYFIFDGKSLKIIFINYSGYGIKNGNAISIGMQRRYILREIKQ